MAKSIPLLFLFFTVLSTQTHSNASDETSVMYPFDCSNNIQTCNAYLYHISRGLAREEIAYFYNVQTSNITDITDGSTKDYLISVPCTCDNISGTVGYFHNTVYKAKSGDTFLSLADKIYSGQAWMEGDGNINAGDVTPIHLLCGCLSGNSQVSVTYTVRDDDTLAGIASLLSSNIDGIRRLNREHTKNPEYIDVGWVLFVPMLKDGILGSKEGKGNKTSIITGIAISIALLAVGVVAMYFYRRRKAQQTNVEDPKAKVVSKTLSAKSTASSQIQYLYRGSLEDVQGFDSERPVVFGLEEIEEATVNCDDSRKIGEGGYGSVYFGILGKQEVAIKKMKSSKSKEFFAELKVLCKVHHINVVELIGYAAGDDHLYLVYEYVRNGSLSDHLHEPLLKGYQPLSWNARAQIALDTARGIEYIHDHTKARYVHRDIKTTNILLDEGLRAKVADFGLAKLVERNAEEDCIATRLVGTPGYLPPESVLELQMTSKTDVFAFGVVLAELITGQRALRRDHREPKKMKSLISVINAIFQDKEPEIALEAIIDGNLKGSYPMDEIYKMAEIAVWCLSVDSANRPEMRNIVVKLSHIMVSSIEWEASLGGNSQIFSGVFNGR